MIRTSVQRRWGAAGLVLGLSMLLAPRGWAAPPADASTNSPEADPGAAGEGEGEGAPGAEADSPSGGEAGSDAGPEVSSGSGGAAPALMPSKEEAEAAATAPPKRTTVEGAGPGAPADEGDPGGEDGDDGFEDDLGEDPGGDDLANLLGSSVVETASRGAEEESTAPATMTVITADEIRAYGMTTVADIINYFGLGLSYQEDGGNDGSTSFTGRGVSVPGDGGNHVLVQVNGHKNNDTWGGWTYVDDRLALPLELIDRIEIINGPGAVMYGTSAMYGVINIVTKDAEQYRGFHGVAQGRLMMPGGEDNAIITSTKGDNDLGWGARASVGAAQPFAVKEKNGGVVFQAEYFQTRRPSHVFGPQDPDWDPGPNAYPDGSWGGTGWPWRRGVGAFLGLRLGNWALDLRGSWWTRRHLEDYQSDFNDKKNNERGAEARVDLRHRAAPKAGVELRTRVFGDIVPYAGDWTYTSPDWCPGLPSRCISREEDVAYLYGVEEVVSWDWFVDGRYTTLFGADVRGRTVIDKISLVDYDDVGTVSSVEGFADYNVTTAAGSFFAQQLVKPVPVFGLNLGARLDVDQLFGAHISPRAAIMVHPWDGGTLKLLYSEAFRAPVAGELNFQDPTYQIKAKDLDAEVVRSLELTGEHRLPRGLGRVRLGGFTSWWFGLIGERTLEQDEFDDAVASGALVPDADPDYAVTYDNYGDFFAAGGFASANLQNKTGFFRFGTNVSFTESWVRAEAKEDRSEIARVPAWIVNARMSIVPGGAIPTFALAAFYNSPRRTPEDVDGEFVTANVADHLLRGRFVISGDIPKTWGLSYRLWADYSLGRYGPYTRGQLNYGEDESFGGELTPLDRLGFFAGLRYDFDWAGYREQRGSK